MASVAQAGLGSSGPHVYLQQLTVRRVELAGGLLEGEEAAATSLMLLPVQQLGMGMGKGELTAAAGERVSTARGVCKGAVGG